MGIYTKKIESIKKVQKQYLTIKNQIINDISKLEKELEKYINKRWKETFEDLQVIFNASFDYGCLASNWKCVVYFYSVGNYEYCKGSFYDLVDENESFTYIAKKVKSPISAISFKKFVKEMAEETGCTCKLLNSSLVTDQLQI